ncbi:MAG: hypothetical protein QNK05_15865 [Myxococcota bacterium]|nr:hypothetical protein [Myxococcota bacterium]
MKHQMTPPDLDAIPDEILEKNNITRDQLAAIHQAMTERDQRTPAVGSEAPDFEIERLSKTGRRTGESLRLSSLRGRPVALVFGSYT